MTTLVADLGLRRGDFDLDISLEVAGGETLALLGPNAAGKSTAVAVLAGLLPLERGRIQLGSVLLDDPAANVFVPPERRRVGVVFQADLLFPHMTVGENVAFGVRDPNGRSDTAAGWLDRVGMEGAMARRPDQLSGGQAQRVALARTLASQPHVLLLDEPLSALDVRNRAGMRQLLAAHLTEFAGPRVLITHDPTEAFLLADRIAIIEDGRLTQSGSVDDIRLRPRTTYAAEIAGTNLVRGTARDGTVTLAGHVLHIADRSVSGPVALSVRPSAVAVHISPPTGSPRNVWETRVERLEVAGDRARIRTGSPLPLSVEITSESVRALALRPGVTVWVSVKATEVEVERL